MSIEDKPVEQLPPHWTNTRYGSMKTPSGSDDLITSFLHHYGEWSFLESRHIASYLPRNARVLDIGAYLGTFSLGLAQVQELSFVALVEANNFVIPYLKKNVEENLQCNTQVVNALIVNPQAPLMSIGHMVPGNSGSVSFSPDSNGAIEIPLPKTVKEFTSLILEFGPFDLVKLDVEGMEESLLSSCPELLRNSDTLIWVECNEACSSVSLAKLLLATGRPLTYFSWPSHNPENFTGQEAQLLPFAHEAGMLLGTEPRELTQSEQLAGCMNKTIRTIEDLRDAMWHTPRWAPREWENLNRFQIAAVTSHALVGHDRNRFLLQAPVPLVKASDALQHDQFRRATRLAEFKIFQLEQALAKASEKTRLSDLCAIESAEKLVEMTEMRDAVMTAEKSLPALSHDEPAFTDEATETPASRASMELHSELETLRTQVAFERQKSDAISHLTQVLSAQLELVNASLHAIRNSLTWRVALRLSKEMTKVPMLKKSLRFIFRR